jgi:glycosyltransferase involved in cell wall biosynthesis
VVVPSYNNAANNRHVNNMNSILMQEYSNYHIVFIDDASTDSTSDDIV